MGAGVSTDPDSTTAGQQAGERAAEAIAAQRRSTQADGPGAACDLAFVLVSAHHVDRLGEVGEAVAKALGARQVVGMAAEAVIAGASEMEGMTGVSVLAGAMPGVGIRVFSTEDLPLGVGLAENAEEEEENDILELSASMGLGPGHRATVLMYDPLSTDMSTMLPAVNRARRLLQRGRDNATNHSLGPIVGGASSVSGRPGGNALLINGRLVRGGLVGVTLSGAVKCDAVVSQGCRAFGPTMIVTGAKGSIIKTLGNRPALTVVKEAIDELSEEQRKALSRGLMLGLAADEYKERFGPGDFLIRTMVNAYQESGAVSVQGTVRVGQTARLHLRDADAAERDLAMLMDAQALHRPPSGVLLFTCTGRGTRLFRLPSHDAGAVQRAFADQSWLQAGEQKAKGGAVLVPAALRPLAGCFAGGEIGPVGTTGDTFLHGQTACALMFRPG